jgi:hypothetical protein
MKKEKKTFFDKKGAPIKAGDKLDLPEEYFFDGIVRLEPKTERLYILNLECTPLYLDAFHTSFTRKYTIQ